MYSMMIRWFNKPCFLTAMVAVAVVSMVVLTTAVEAEELTSLITLVGTNEAETEAAAVTVTGDSDQSDFDSAASSTLDVVPQSTLQVVPSRAAQTPPAKTQSGSAEPQKTITAKKQDSLQPIPDQQLDGPAKVETASFKGVIPGISTAEQLQEAWGSPKEIRSSGRQKQCLFTVEPFEQVEVSLSGDIVQSIVINLEKPFPAGAVAKQLQLGNIRPVFISNELGDVLGQAFPERGVMFAFVQNHKPGQPSMQVDKIVLEPVDAEAFVLRAETNIDVEYSNTLKDLDIAIGLSPENAKAHWLRSRALTAIGDFDKAAEAGRKAVQLAGDDPQYRLALARVLAQSGGLEEAIKHTQKAIADGEHRPHIKAAAHCLLGDLYSLGENPKFNEAVKQHTAAIKMADPLSVDRHPAIRLAAKEVLIDAHLGAANDIAWGGWSQKEKAVEKWCQRAAAFAEELIANDGGTEEHRFRVATRCLAAYVGVQGKLDPEHYAEEAVNAGDALIGLAEDPAKKRQLQCDLGMAMFNAMQIAQTRKDNQAAIKYGEKTAAYMEAAIEHGLNNPSAIYLLGRLYFRVGSIHALAKKDHAAAIEWFDKAVPMLSRPLPDDSQGEVGRHGETFVSMGVSYWTTGEKKKALELTKAGLALMNRAVEQGVMNKSALSVPYQNLAAMQRHMGNGESAEKLEQMAKSVMAAKNDKKTIKR